MFIEIITTLLLGLALGSFLNVVIFRVDDIKSILTTRSHCPHCKKNIKWYDLVPLISFMVLRGKCRYCSADISVQYPLVEAGTALMFLAMYLKFGITWQAAIYALAFLIFIVIFVYDIKTQYILDAFSYSALAVCLVCGVFFANISFIDLIYGILIGGGFLAVLVFVSREKWMGKGDIIIGSALGAMLGYPRAVLLIFLSFVLGSLVGLALIYTRKKGMKDAVPFAPFLITAGLITLLFGNYIISWYLGTIYLGGSI